MTFSSIQSFYCGYIYVAIMSSTILKSSWYGAHILMLLANRLLYIKFSRLTLLLGNFLVQRCKRVCAHTPLRVHRYMCVHMCVEQLLVRSDVLTVYLLEQRVFTQFQSRCKISICCTFLSLKPDLLWKYVQYVMVIFSLSIYLYWVLDFFLALLVCEPPGRRFISIYWVDK